MRAKTLTPALCLLLISLALALTPASASATTGQTFTGCGGFSTNAPTNAISASVTVRGSSGGYAGYGGNPGNGAAVSFTTPVSSGQALYGSVGCQPGGAGWYGNGNGSSGSNGSGGSGGGGYNNGGTGGNASWMGTSSSMTNAFGIAGGGGGAGAQGEWENSAGGGGNGGYADNSGNGGGTEHDNSESAGGGNGGAAGESGAGGAGRSGGCSANGSGGGCGGAGYYDYSCFFSCYDEGSGGGGGGGGGYVGGGGGGGGYTDSDGYGGGGGGGGGGRSAVLNGATITGSGYNGGNGSVSITYTIGAVASVPASYALPSTTVGTVSAPDVVTVSNTSTDTPLSVGQLSISGSSAFRLVAGDDNCSGTTVPANGSCTVSVSFAPTALGAQGASLIIPSNALNGTQSTSLSGTGTGQPTISVNPAAKNYSTLTTGQTANQTFTLSNTGTTSMSVGALALSGTNASAFSIVAGQDNCSGQSVSAAGHCTVAVSFHPSTDGAKTASLSVPSNASNGNQTVGLSGSGANPPADTATANALDFANQQTATTSHAQTVTFTNTGDETLVFGTDTLTGAGASQYAATSDTCSGQSIAGGASCSVTVVFAPTSAGAATASYNLPSNATTGTPTIALTGTGLTPPQASTDQPAHDFGTVVTGHSQTQTVTVTDTGQEPLHVGAAALTGANPDQFAIGTDTCSQTTVTAGNTCTIAVSFVPTVNGAQTAALSVASDDPNSPALVSLTGAGLAPPSITITTPSAREHVTLGSDLTPDYTCTGQDVDHCTTTPIDTSDLGPHEFTVSAVATDGSVLLSKTVAYVVDPAAYADLILGDHPTAYYRFDDTGSTLTDSSGNGHNGVLVNGALTHRDDSAIACESATPPAACATAADSRGYSAFFPARDGYGYVNNIPAPQNGYTIEAWVKPADGSDMSIAGQGGAGQLFISGGELALRQTQDTLTASGAAGAVPAGQWSFVAATWDGSTTTLDVNGQAVATSTSDNKAPSGTSTFYVGYGDQAPWMHGNLDEVAYYNHAISAGDLAELYADGTAYDHASLGAGDLDTAAPAISLTSPADGGTYTATKVPAVAFTCSDLDGAADLASCTATADGNPLSSGDSLPAGNGSHTVTVTATDQEGLTTTVTHTYTVEGYAQVILSDNPLAYWRLGDDATSSTMADASGNGHDGIYVNDTTQGPAGISGDGDTTRAMLGAGGYGYVNNIAAPTSAYTVEAWADPADTGDMSILSAAGDLYLSAGHYTFKEGSVVLTDPTAAAANTWTQLVGTDDGQTATLYENGVSVASAPVTGSPSGASTVYVGHGDQAPWMRGNLDEVAYYDHALNAERVWEHFLADPPTTSVPAGAADTTAPTGSADTTAPTGVTGTTAATGGTPGPVASPTLPASVATPPANGAPTAASKTAHPAKTITKKTTKKHQKPAAKKRHRATRTRKR